MSGLLLLYAGPSYASQGRGDAASRAANSSSESATSAPATFSSRCLTRLVPGIGIITGLRLSIHASAIWLAGSSARFFINGIDTRTRGFDVIGTYRHAASCQGLSVVGIDCHIGSQITQVEPYLDALDRPHHQAAHRHAEQAAADADDGGRERHHRYLASRHDADCRIDRNEPARGDGLAPVDGRLLGGGGPVHDGVGEELVAERGQRGTQDKGGDDSGGKLSQGTLQEAGVRPPAR